MVGLDILTKSMNRALRLCNLQDDVVASFSVLEQHNLILLSYEEKYPIYITIRVHEDDAVTAMYNAKRAIDLHIKGIWQGTIGACACLMDLLLKEIQEISLEKTGQKRYKSDAWPH